VKSKVGIGVTKSSPAALVAKLVSKHERRIRRFIGRRSGPEVLKRATVDDIFQDTVAAAIASADNFVFQDDDRFVAWITTIARRVIAHCVAYARRGPSTIRIKRAESSGVGVPESQLSPGGRTPSSLAAGQEREAAIRKAIGKLPERYSQVLTLYKLEERSLAEVAERMGRSKGATCRLIARAIRQLRRMTADNGRVQSA
jgi:RNA polymerase sigma-70 factor (ECF subfamily)